MTAPPIWTMLIINASWPASKDPIILKMYIEYAIR